ncbi:MAG: hypothetical protein ACREPA_10465 [Candidatus Dormibacteraceae bacterium]
MLQPMDSGRPRPPGTPPSAPRLELGGPLGEGRHGPTWRARLDGVVVTAKRLPKPGTRPSGLLKRLADASAVRDAHLLPILLARREAGSVWVVCELDTGVSLARLTGGRKLPRACAISVALGVLNGLTGLHQAGLWHGAVHPGNVHVGRDGNVRLGHFALGAPGHGQSAAALRAADVRAAGTLLLGLLGIHAGTRRKAPRVASTPIGEAALAMATVAESRSGYEAARASLALWESGGRLAATRRQAQARQELARLVEVALRPAGAGGGSDRVSGAVEEPPAAGRVGGAHAVALAAPRRVSPPWRGVAVGMGLVAACALLTVASFHFPSLAAGITAAPGPTPVAQRPDLGPAPFPPPPPAAAPRTPPVPKPAAGSVLHSASLGPAGAGAVLAVSAWLAGACGPPAGCPVAVQVSLRPALTSRAVSWELDSVNACTGAATVLARDSVVARPGWTRVLGVSEVQPPGSSLLVAVTREPAHAASAPLRMEMPPAC